MSRSASTASVVALLLAVSLPAPAQVRWVDKAGKTHVTDKMPAQEDVTADEWKRLQAEDEKKKQAAAADAETLPAPAEGVVLKWKGKDGVEHHTNAPPRRSEVSDAEWERLKADIPKLNEAAAKAAESKAPDAPKAEAPADAGGEKLPDLPAGRTLLWTAKDGKRHMTSTPPTQNQVSGQEWERLKKAIADMIEEAKNAPPPPPETPKVEEPKAEEPKAEAPADAPKP